jgi:adenosylhomocysteine nucleosidase
VPHVAVLAPMPLELDAVVAAFGLEASAGGVFWTGRVGGSAVTALRTGMGPARARRETEQVLDRTGHGVDPVDHVMVVGICGGLDPGIPVGTVLRPEVVVDHTTGARFRHSPPGDGPTSGGIVTTEGVAFDDDLSRALAARGFTGVDMESSAVARACVARGRPWTVHRCISDRYVDRLLDPSIVALTDADGNVDVDAVVRLIDDDPTLGPKLDRLGRDAAEAARLAAEDALAACLLLDRAGTA